MANLVHRITQLASKGNGPADLAGTSSDVRLTEAMKAKYKLEKRTRWYVI